MQVYIFKVRHEMWVSEQREESEDDGKLLGNTSKWQIDQ